MMMPECGNIEIKYDTGARDGFRLGLMQDFGLDVSDVEDTKLDDIIYIDTKGKSGIIAGSMLVFIPAIGEYVIPELLGGKDSIIIEPQHPIEIRDSLYSKV